MEPVDVVRRYLRVFETGDLAELEAVVAEDVEIWGAGNRVVGRRYPAEAVTTPGLSDCRVDIVELFAAGDRVVAYFVNIYRHDATGRDVRLSGIKMYQVSEGRIIRFWGETDLFGLLRQLGKVSGEISFD
ncbi:ester cyclase [Longispora urticae]